MSEFIFTSAPFASCHASTIVELRNGDILAAWFGGTAEGKPDAAIWGARRSAGKWTPPIQLVRELDTPTWNPVLFHSADGLLWLYYKFGSSPVAWSAGRIWSSDEGQTWSAPEHLPAGILGPIKNKPLVLDDGTIVSGSSIQTRVTWTVWIERSTDNGIIWTRVGPITAPTPILPLRDENQSPNSSSSESPYGIIQPAIVSLGGNRLRLFARSSIGAICVVDSSDRGLTWTQAHSIALPNPNSGIDAVRLKDGRIVIAYNNTTSGRTPLNLSVSEDGEYFQMFRTLESELGEFSYPAIIQGRDGDVHITYTWNRTRIRYIRLSLSDIPN